MHAVGRGAVQIVEAIGRGVGRQRPVQGQRVGGAARVLLRCNDIDLSQALTGSYQRSESRCEIAIIVCNE